METVKISGSGGKDSTTAVYLHILKRRNVKVVNYIPMFTDDIPLITREHYDFIQEIAQDFKYLSHDLGIGCKVYFVSGISYVDLFYKPLVKGRRKGEIHGFPSANTRFCLFRSDSKVRSLRACDVGDYDYEDIGIAFDEVKRHAQFTDKKRSILVEEGYTEDDCLRFCSDVGALSPVYKYGGRDGCALCPNGDINRVHRWLSDYPEARPILLKLIDDNKRYCEYSPLRNGKYWEV